MTKMSRFFPTSKNAPSYIQSTPHDKKSEKNSAPLLFPISQSACRAGLGPLCDVLALALVVVMFFSVIVKTTSYKNLHRNKVVDPSEKDPVPFLSPS